MSYLAALDLGTSSVRAIIFDENANQISSHSIEWEHFAEENVNGAMNFDCKSGWQKICNCIKNAIAKADINPKDILAISATSMREGIVIYDKHGNEIWAVANVDSRAGKEVAWLKQNMPDFEKHHYELSGQTLALGAIPRLLWLKNNRPSIFEQAKKITMISEWALYKLSGEFAAEPTNAGTSGIFNLKMRKWEPSLCDSLGLGSDFFPTCDESSTVIGSVTVQASTQTNLCVGTKVVLGGGDVQLGCIGLGITKPMQSAAIGGTFWQQLVNIEAGITDPSMRLRINPHAIDGLSQAEGITFFVGTMTKWFRDAFCDYEKESATKRNIDVYQILEELASKVSVGSNGILPIFSNTMNYAEWKHAAPSLLNLSLDAQKCSKGAIFRSMQENAAIVSALNLQEVEQFAGKLSNTLVFAGGASKGNLWSQILADATNKNIKVPTVKEATSLGCAFCAGIGAGIYQNFDETSSLIQWEKEFEPNQNNVAKYRDIALLWQQAYEAQLNLADNGTTQHMWKAPGI